MRIIRATAPGALRLARLREVSGEARLKLSWMDYSEAHGRNAALTCRRFGISRQTLDVVCRWDVVEVRRRATSATATSLLEVVMERMSFPVRALTRLRRELSRTALAYLTLTTLSHAGSNNERRSCVTNLLDEHRGLTRK